MNFVNKLSTENNDLQNNESGDESDLIILGNRYPPFVYVDNENSQTSAQGFLSNIFSRRDITNQEFLSDLYTKLHFTYRTRFTPIPRSEDGPSPITFQRFLRDNPLNSIENVISNPDCFTTDIGWGCMIRTGQSLLGNALQIANLGRRFRLDEESNDKDSISKYNEIISWFQDNPDYPFSFHNFVKNGCKYNDMKPGQWFGPAATSTSIKKLIEDFPECGIDDCLISVSSGDIFQCDVDKIFSEKQDSKVLILLGVKLGLNNINISYTKDIIQLLNSKYSVGIAGGRPSSSLYFFGYQGEDLLYFDPHVPQSCLEPSIFSSCNSTTYGKLNVTNLDPSMLIGILINGENDWQNWKNECEHLQIINIQDTHYSDIDAKYDEFDISSMDSGKSDHSKHPPGGLCNDYIDIEPLETNFRYDTISNDDTFEKIDCKTQQIMILRSIGCADDLLDIPYDIESELVEQETHEVIA